MSASDDQARELAGDDKPKALEPLDDEVLVRRSIEVFPAGYLTFISIIQGVALGVVITQAVSSQSLPGPVMDDGMLLLRASITLFTVIFISYQYLWFTILMRWPLTFVDSLIPFVLGTTEILPALFLDRPSPWWFCSATLAGVGGFAFLNTVWNMSPAQFKDNAAVYSAVHGLLKKEMLLAWLLCLVGVGAGILSVAGHDRIATVAGGLIFSGVSGYLTWRSEATLFRIYDHYGLPLRARQTARRGTPT